MGALPKPTLPPGPARSLFEALHELHHRAGWPSLRDMSREVGCSHTTISAAFSEPRVPRWGLLELIVETLGNDTEEFHRLWLAATGTSPEPSTPTLPSVPRQLPADVGGFTGRTEQLTELDQLYAASGDGVRLGVLTGTAGVGKTALAVHWAHRVADRFPDGQLYLNLRGYDPESPLQAAEALEYLLRALGIDGAAVPQDRSERAARYRSAIAGRRMLVVLDNIGSVEQVRDLLPGDRSALVLVTSRDAMSGLVARHGARRITLDLLPETDAVALLRTMVGPRVDALPEAAAALTRRTARLPLALRIVAELALARSGDTLADLVTEFDDEAERLDLLSAGDDRYTAVRAVFSWSQHQLADDARRAFAMLGLHPGPDIDEHAAAALLGTDLRPARRLLGALTRAHLVESRTRGRYSMHDLLRAYAAELSGGLSEGERLDALTRLFDHYLTSASGVDHSAVGHAWLDAERTNLLAVAAAAAERWPAHTVGAAAALARYLDAHAYYSDALALDELALTAARASGDRGGEATALNLLGGVHRRLGGYAEADVFHERALRIHLELGDRAGEAAARHGLGIVSWRSGRYAQAQEHLERALEMFLALGDQVGEGHVLYVLGVAELKLGHYPEAIEHLERAVALNRRIGERTGEGRAVNNLGEVYLRVGRVEEAAGAYAASLDIARELGNRAGVGVALANLATIAVCHGRHEDALTGYYDALAICRSVGYRVGEADVLCGLGFAYRLLGRHDDAIASMRAALATSHAIGAADAQTGVLNELGVALQVAGRGAESIASFRDALTLAERTGDKYELARAHLGLAGVLGEPGEVYEHERAGRAAFAELGLPIGGPEPAGPLPG